jgi:UrcA family protein
MGILLEASPNYYCRRVSMSIQATSRISERRFKCAVLLLSGGLTVASTAGASPADRDVPTVVIHYTVASLATDIGVHALYRRIEMAAEKVCPHAPAASQLPNEALIKCRHDTIAEAVAQVHNPRLVTLYAESN